MNHFQQGLSEDYINEIVPLMYLPSLEDDSLEAWAVREEVIKIVRENPISTYTERFSHGNYAHALDDPRIDGIDHLAQKINNNLPHPFMGPVETLAELEFMRADANEIYRIIRGAYLS